MRQLASRIPGDWDREAFVTRAIAGLEELELKARVVHITEALHQVLPASFPEAVALVEQGVDGPRSDTDSLVDDWGCWVLCTFVERYGLAHPQRALDAMERLTSHFSCEFALRPYFQADPGGVTARVERWARSDDPHLRRLASEGTRPRLPWGIRLHDRIEHPERLLPVLQALRDDPSQYVRRSVANHLNDIAKDHRDLVVEIGREWMRDAPPDRVRLVRHALRTHIKAGDPRAYEVIGLRPFDGSVHVELSEPQLVLGQALEIRVELILSRPQRLRLDLGIHHQRKDGSFGLKVFHWTERTLEQGTHSLVRKQRIRRVSTRAFYPGEQGFDLRINGEAGEVIAFFVEER